MPRWLESKGTISQPRRRQFGPKSNCGDKRVSKGSPLKGEGRVFRVSSSEGSPSKGKGGSRYTVVLNSRLLSSLPGKPQVRRLQEPALPVLRFPRV
ncbi:hypothetical protein ACP70R_011662 [Stipagrostis hirtigluma subsp. patula]